MPPGSASRTTRSQHPLFPSGRQPGTYFGSLLFGLFQFVHFNLLGFGYEDEAISYTSSSGRAPPAPEELLSGEGSPLECLPLSWRSCLTGPSGLGKSSAGLSWQAAEASRSQGLGLCPPQRGPLLLGFRGVQT